MHLPCRGLARLRTGEAGLHTQQQAQGDPPGDAVGSCARRSHAGRGRHGGLSRGQLIDTRANITPVYNNSNSNTAILLVEIKRKKKTITGN